MRKHLMTNEVRFNSTSDFYVGQIMRHPHAPNFVVRITHKHPGRYVVGRYGMQRSYDYQCELMHVGRL